MCRTATPLFLLINVFKHLIFCVISFEHFHTQKSTFFTQLNETFHFLCFTFWLVQKVWYISYFSSFFLKNKTKFESTPKINSSEIRAIKLQRKRNEKKTGKKIETFWMFSATVLNWHFNQVFKWILKWEQRLAD